MAANTISFLLEEIGSALGAISGTLASDEEFQKLAVAFGWEAPTVPAPIADVAVAMDAVVDAVEDYVDGDRSPADLTVALDRLLALGEALSDLESATFDPILVADDFGLLFPRQLIDYATIRYVQRTHPATGFALELLGIFRIRYEGPRGNRPDHMHFEVAWSEVPQLLEGPEVVFQNAHGWGTGDLDSQRVLEILADFLTAMGVPAHLRELDREQALVLEARDDPPDRPVRWRLMMPLEAPGQDGEVEAGVALLALPEVAARLPGFALMPFASREFEQTVQLDDTLRLEVKSALDLEGGVGLVLRPGEGMRLVAGLSDPDNVTEVTGTLRAQLAFAPPEPQPTVLLGSEGGTRVEAESAAARAGFALTTDDSDLFVEVELQGARFVLAPGESDGFVRAVLPESGIAAGFSLAVGLSTQRGVYFRGSSVLEIAVPARVSLGPVEFSGLVISVRPGGGGIPIDLGANVLVRLGPLAATVENIGLTADLEFPGQGGNLGPMDVRITPKPPTGLGLSIDGGGFKGGGFLSFDKANERYAGVLELEYQNTIALKALGLLTTRLPGGEQGYSLLIVISAEFTPIQLGFGFTLNGVGGLLGLNRTARLERLRNGIRDNTLDSVLFPIDVVANANRILSDLREVFPPQDGRFVFGPMGKLGWGTPTLLTLSVGLVVEVPDPVRMVILGVLKAILPDEERGLLKLQVNFLAAVDFERRQLSLDASLYESKLLSYTLTGDMAVRFTWGSDPNFLLTVGGFHPAYDPPPLALPSLRRLSLQLLAGTNPRLRLDTYFAVTSNTVQFGARLELYAGKGSFNVYGFLGFDALFQFDPFYFVASISAMLALRKGSRSLASIKLSMTLEGPTPWKVAGTAKLKLFWFLTVKISFSKRFGEERDTRLDDVDILPLLVAVLSEAGNWHGETPPGRHLLVSLGEIDVPPDSVVAHPSGVLSISQKLVPLNLTIDTFGHRQPSGAKRFEITEVQAGEGVNGLALEATPTKEFFAPAQFFERSDEQKLSSKSFEKYDAGVRIAGSEALDADTYRMRDVEYELSYIDSQRDLKRWHLPISPFAVAFEAWSTRGAIARSPLSHANNAKSALAPPAVSVAEERFAVVHQSDLTLATAPGGAGGGSFAATEAEAFELMHDLIAAEPGLAGSLQVVPEFEL